MNKSKWNRYIVLGLIASAIIVVVICIILCNTLNENIISKYEIINLCFTGYGSFSLILLVLQFIMSQKDTNSRHDEKRREKTVEYLIKWSSSLNWETTYAIKIVETFNHKQCTALYNGLAFDVDYNTKQKLCIICSKHLTKTCDNCFKSEEENHENPQKQTKEEKVYKIDDRQCAEIRWFVIKYLNHLEALLISWKEGIVDKEIIEEQFSYLYDPKLGRDTLQSFRNVAGDGASYPTIEEFCLKLRNNSHKSSNKAKDIL